MSIYEHTDQETSRSIMKLKHQHNNIHAVVLDENMPIKDITTALGNIQKEMKEQEEKDIVRLWGQMSRDVGREIPVPEPGFHTTIHHTLKGAFDYATSDMESEADLLWAIRLGKLLMQYERQYPEYCFLPKNRPIKLSDL